MTDWPISQRLREYLEIQYDLRSVLGEGGMGVVLLATERTLDRQVAIKVLHKYAAAQPELRERFRREARVAAKLTHPNIVPLHTFGDVEGELFFVMGFVEGETLASRLRRERRIAQQEAIRILREVCDALALAHANNVVHRDIKPENVLIEARSGRTLLADFGIAREGTESAALTGTGMAIGTPHYMSPEQAVPSGGIDHRADIYAVGVLAYRMLSGRLPFDGANAREIIAQQMAATPQDFSREAPDVSPNVIAAIMRCLEKDPAARWPSVSVLRDVIAPGDVGDEELPDELMDADAGLTKLAIASGVSSVFWTLNHFWWNNELIGTFSAMGAIAPLGGGALLCAAVARRHGLKRTLSVALRPPRWWPLWWPSFARRPGDVWDRLPSMLRAARTLLFGSVALSGAGVGTFVALMMTLRPEQLARFIASPITTNGMLVLTFGGGVGTLAGVFLSYVRWRRLGRTAPPAARNAWLGEPVASPRWRRPELAQYLAAEPERRAPIPDSADKLAAVIGDVVDALVREGVIPSGDPAVVAREVVQTIAGIDRELAVLARGGDVAELQRLDERIDAAGTDGLTGDIVEMLVRQRDGVRKIIARQEAQQRRRERLVAQLRELFLALEHVRDRAAASSATANTGGVTDRIELACSDLRRLASGYDAVHDIATTPIAS